MIAFLALYSSVNKCQAAQHCFAADAAGAAPGLGAILKRGGVPSRVPVQTLASSAAESWRWAAEEGPASFHGGANQKNQPQILYTHARKSLSEPSERDRGVNRFTFTHRISRPNHQTYSEASIVVHLNMKYPVRTIRHTQRRQSFYI